MREAFYKRFSPVKRRRHTCEPLLDATSHSDPLNPVLLPDLEDNFIRT